MSRAAAISPAVEAAAELRREIVTRERIFPRWVADGRLTQAQADQRINALRTALAIVDAQIERERLL